jgi:hypothetical protein
MHPWFIDVRRHHQIQAQGCLRVLKDELQFNICRLPTSYNTNASVDDLHTRAATWISPQLNYSSRFWAFHLSHSPVIPPLLEEITQFLRRRLLNWLEILSVEDIVGSAAESLHSVLRWIPVRPSFHYSRTTLIELHRVLIVTS